MDQNIGRTSREGRINMNTGTTFEGRSANVFDADVDESAPMIRSFQSAVDMEEPR